jgi:hypothetical protein
VSQADLGRAFGMLSKTIYRMCTNTDDLKGRLTKALNDLSGTWEGDFPSGELKKQWQAIQKELTKGADTTGQGLYAAAISAMTENEAKTLIQMLTTLHEDVQQVYYRKQDST